MLVARTAQALFVLTPAHVVGKSRSVSVWIPPDYRRYSGEVVATSTFREDLALLRIAPPPPGKGFLLRLAPDFAKGERRRSVDVMVTTLEGKPFVYSGPIIEDSVLWATSQPDENGSANYVRLMACVYGGAVQANSGAPVFQGDRLVGLHEVSPYHAEIDGIGVIGLGISIPQRIRAFLEKHGYAKLLR